MTISFQPEKTLPNWGIKDNLSFGNSSPKIKFKDTISSGETYVVVNNNLYFDKFTPQNILSALEKNFDNNEEQLYADTMKKYFLPFRRLSQISNKNAENIDGCKIVTAASDRVFSQIKKLSQMEREKRAFFWLPSVVIDETNKKINWHNKMSYVEANSLTINNDKKSILQKITDNLINIIKREEKSNLVIAVGNKEEDLLYVDPFRRLGLNPNKENSFKRIKDLPFRSVFICDENTPLKLRYKLAKLESLCNFDKQLRFMVIDTNQEYTINKIAEAIMLLQKDYANYNEKFRKNITEDLLGLLASRQTQAPNNIKTSPKWVIQEDFVPSSFLKSAKTFLLNNKTSASLLLTAIIVPIYIKYFYNPNSKN